MKIDYNEIFKDFHKSGVVIAGPCAVESWEQISSLAKLLKGMGIKYLRAGAFKPRTSPMSFQGLGLEGQRLLKKAAEENDMLVVSEILDSSLIDDCYDLIDIVQIGSRNMAAYHLLKNIGKKTAVDHKPVLLKRGFNSTLNELILASGYISKEGNSNIILCLRGIRTFEQIDSKLRYTPDLASILELKTLTDYPVIFDPSHSSGDASFVEAISKAALVLGANGLLIEVHQEPHKALSDGQQSILPTVIKNIVSYVETNYKNT